MVRWRKWKLLKMLHTLSSTAYVRTYVRACVRTYALTTREVGKKLGVGWGIQGGVLGWCGDDVTSPRHIPRHSRTIGNTSDFQTVVSGNNSCN